MNGSLRRVLPLAVALVAWSTRADGYLSRPDAYRPLLTTVGGGVAVPTLDLRSDFIGATSSAGLDFGVRYEVGARLSAGGELAWARFQQSSTLGDRFQMDAVSLGATVHYYFTGSEIQPYAGFGLGGLYRKAVLNGGPTQTGWGLCGGPELGLLLTLREGLALNVSARYEVTTASFDVNGDPDWKVKFPSWLGAQVGLALY